MAKKKTKEKNTDLQKLHIKHEPH